MELLDLKRVFDLAPGQWGLRGDPYLWQELEHAFAHLQLPRTSQSIDALLTDLYTNLVGEAPVTGRRPYISRYAGGGMSSGTIEASFWLEHGFPELKRRMLELLPTQPGYAGVEDRSAAQLRSALLGLAVGDALGVPVEFQPRRALQQQPVVGMRAQGTHRQPAGTWSDDASLTFCLAEAIAAGFSLKKVADNSRRWYEEAYWTPHCRVFDIGNLTRDALQRMKAIPGLLRAGGTDEYSNGNGSLMRILPLAFYQEDIPLPERFQLIADVSAITHGHVRSAIACFLYLEMARHLRAGLAPYRAYAQLCMEATTQLQALNIPENEVAPFTRILSGDLATVPEEEIHSSGYVLHTLEAALWCLLRYNTFADTVLAAVNLGEDTDTTGAVVGGLAGICYGAATIPQQWLEVLVRRSDIENLATRMAAGPGTAPVVAAGPPPLPQQRPIANSYWATPAVLGCEYPGDLNPEAARVKLTALLAAGITDFFDLTEAHELNAYEPLLQQLAAERRAKVFYHRFPIRDVQVPTPKTLEAILKSLADAVAAGRKAAVHCWGGVGRTGTVIGCYLVRHEQLSGSEALAHLAQQWKGVAKSHRKPHTPETAAQFQLVESFK